MPDESHIPPDHRLPPPEHTDALLPEHASPSSLGDVAPSLPGSDLAMRMLYDEQQRLRSQLDDLRKQDQGGARKEEGGDKEKEEDAEDKQQSSQPRTVEEAAAERRKKARYIFLGVIGLLLLIVLALLLLWYLGSYENTDDAFVDGHTDPISTRISGTVANVFVENTYRVKKGQLLLVLDPRDNQVAKEQALAAYDRAQAAIRTQQPQVPITAEQQRTQALQSELDVVRLGAQVSQNEEQYQANLANLHEAEANAANADREEERYHQLVVKDEVSWEQYDQRLTQKKAQHEQVAARTRQAEASRRLVSQTEAQLEQARALAHRDRANLPRQIEMQRQTLAQRQAEAASNKAQADQAELNLEYTRIYAPEDGIIGNKQVQLATQVAAGQQLMSLTQSNDIWVTANFKETQVRKMRKGQTVKMKVDALGETFTGFVEDLPGGTGAVYSLLPPENATGNYVKVVQRLPVRIRFNPGQKDLERLAPGMSVEPKVLFR
jgi:membrane fusion protein (multidrug efflux system)